MHSLGRRPYDADLVFSDSHRLGAVNGTSSSALTAVATMKAMSAD